MGRGALDCHIDTFSDDSVGIRVGDKYVSTDSDGLVRNDRTWCREWERYHLVRRDTLNGIALLCQNSWLSNDDRRVISPIAAATIDLRREFAFGPAHLRSTEKAPSLIFETSDGGNDDPPVRLHVISGRGTINIFSRFKPLVYYCLYGPDSFYECLQLSLTSLAIHGRYNGAIGVACDRPISEVIKFIPAAFHNQLIISAASKHRDCFNRYDLDHGLYDDYQPILYSDVDVVFDCDINNLLIDLLLQRQLCCATEANEHPNLANQSPRLWPTFVGNFFGRYLYAAEPAFPEKAVLANAGVQGFDNTARVRIAYELVKAIASRVTSDFLGTFGDQPILNYVLHKTGYGNFELMNRYCRATREMADPSPAERRGLVHFHVWSAAEGPSAKSRIMRSYLDRLARHEAEANEDPST
ncbi:MAG: hypothetical protein ACLPKT_23025 [Methylocella sp.]